MLANASFVAELRTLGQEVQTVDGLPESTAPGPSSSASWDGAAADKVLADVHVHVLLRRWRERDAKPKPVPTPTIVPVVSRGARRRKGTES